MDRMIQQSAAISKKRGLRQDVRARNGARAHGAEATQSTCARQTACREPRRRGGGGGRADRRRRPEGLELRTAKEPVSCGCGLWPVEFRI
jgi:hypothetical protein